MPLQHCVVGFNQKRPSVLIARTTAGHVGPAGLEVPVLTCLHDLGFVVMYPVLQPRQQRTCPPVKGGGVE